MKFLLCVCSILGASGLNVVKKRDFVSCTVNSPGMRCLRNDVTYCGAYSWREIEKDQSDEQGAHKRFTTCQQFGEHMDCGEKMTRQNAVTLATGVAFKQDCCMPTCDNPTLRENQGCCLGHGVGGPVQATVKNGQDVVALIGKNGILFTDKNKEPVDMKMMVTAHDDRHGHGTMNSKSLIFKSGIVNAKKTPCGANKTEGRFEAHMKLQLGVFKSDGTEGVIYSDGIKFTSPNTKIDHEKAYVFANAHACGGPVVDLLDEVGRPLSQMQLNAQIVTGHFEGPTGGRSSVDAMTSIIQQTGTSHRIPQATSVDAMKSDEDVTRHTIHGSTVTETS